MMKIDYVELLQKYLESNIDPFELNLASDSLSANRKSIRGMSSSIPSASSLNKTRISQVNLAKIKSDVASGLVSRELCIFWIDIITLNTEYIDFEEGCLDLLETINSTEDLEAWISEK